MKQNEQKTPQTSAVSYTHLTFSSVTEALIISMKGAMQNAANSSITIRQTVRKRISEFHFFILKYPPLE